MEGRIKRLERGWANPGPDPETVGLWASLWTALEIEESQATAFALEFLLDCESRGQGPYFGYGPGGLMSWLDGSGGCEDDVEDNSGGVEDDADDDNG